MFAFSKGATGCSIYDRVTLKFSEGYNKMKDAIEHDEATKRNGSVADKLRTAELYKEGRQLMKEANQFNIMDIPESKRSEVRETREKMMKLDTSAQERIVKICDELDPNARKARNGPSGTPRISPPGSRSAVARNARAVVPGKKSANVKKNDENKLSSELVHVCSRGDRRGAHNHPMLAQKPTPTVKPLARKAGNSQRTDLRKATVTSAQQNAINRAALLKGVDQNIGERLLDEVLDSTGVRMDDVAGCQGAKAALEEAVILPALNPNLFSGLRQPVKGILLYGPPGNGKTLLAKAVAGDSKQMFFNISASSLTSKWVGDSEKTIRSLFQIARNAQPSIIFIDEIDSILCERSEKEAEVSRRMKTEFLVQFDGATSSPDDRILVIGATNRPHELDDAVLRRFPKRIMLNLPDGDARKELITKTLKKHNMLSGLSDRDIRYIASATSGFSNSDLVALCKEAAMVPIREIDKSKLMQTDGTKLRGIKASDFDVALRTIRPSTSEKIMAKLVDFSRNFGC